MSISQISPSRSHVRAALISSNPAGRPFFFPAREKASEMAVTRSLDSAARFDSFTC